MIPELRPRSNQPDHHRFFVRLKGASGDLSRILLLHDAQALHLLGDTECVRLGFGEGGEPVVDAGARQQSPPEPRAPEPRHNCGGSPCGRRRSGPQPTPSSR